MSRLLNGYALTNHFRKLRLREPFSPLEAYLFFELVAICNDEGWPTEFNASNGVLQAALGCSEQGLIKARQRLEKAGLIVFVSGNRRLPTSYQFTGKGSTEFSLSARKGSTEDSTQFSLSAAENTDGSTEGSTEGSTQFSPYIKEIETKKEVEEKAASAATPPSSFLTEKSAKPKPAARPKKAAAHADEVAALELPHPSAEFAELWAEFRSMPKQVKKPVTSLRRLLVTLGKYEAGFAQIMLEKAIEGNWSGVEFDGTAKTYGEWRAAQAERARRQPTRTNSPDGDGPEPNQEFLDEVAARRQAEEDAHFARWHVPSPVVDPNKEFGYNQTAAEGLAQARATPEYQQYLAELEAAKKQAATDAEPEPPAPENPSDAPQQVT